MTRDLNYVSNFKTIWFEKQKARGATLWLFSIPNTTMFCPHTKTALEGKQVFSSFFGPNRKGQNDARPPPRRNKALGYANAVHLEAITYAIPVRKLAISDAARAKVKKLKRRAKRVLSVLAAVHRAGRRGYLGIEAPYDATAATVRRATDEPCGRSTLERALKELEREGLIVRTWGSELTERTESGKFRPKVIEIGNGRLIAARIRIIALTPAAISIWCYPRVRSSRGGDCDKSIMSKSGTSDPIETQPLAVSPKVPSKTTKRIESNDAASERKESQGDMSTSAMPLQPSPVERAPTAKSSPVKHQASTTIPAPPCLPSQQPASPSTKPKPKQDRLKNAVGKSKTGPTVTPPPSIPSKAPSTWDNNRIRLLRTLFFFLAKFSPQEADYLYARARMETRADYRVELGTAIDWQYFVQRWHGYSRSTRYHTVRRVLLPALKAEIGLPRDIPPPDLSRSSCSAGPAIRCADNEVMTAVKAALEATIARAKPVEAARLKTWIKLF